MRATFLLLLFLLAAGCETAFDVAVPEHEPVLVVNGFLEAGALPTVHLSHSYRLDEEVATLLNSGYVTVYEGNHIMETLHPTFWGQFAAGTFRPLPGHTYTIRAGAEGFSEVVATDIIPAYPLAVLGPVRDVEETRSCYDTIELTLQLTDPGDAENYYTISVESEVRRSGRVFEVRANAFSSRDPLLTDGRTDELLTDDERFYAEAFFNDTPINGRTTSIVLRTDLFRYDRPECAPTFGGATFSNRLVVSTVSEATYRYLRAMYLYDPDNPFSEPVQPPSTVLGGLGIVGGVARVRLPLALPGVGQTMVE